MAKSKKAEDTKRYILEKYELSDIDKNIIKYKLQFPEITHEELALLLDTQRSYITKRFNTPAVKKAMAELEDNFGADWVARVIKAREKASKKLVKLLDDKNSNIVLKAIENILPLKDLSSVTDNKNKSIPIEIIKTKP